VTDAGDIVARLRAVLNHDRAVELMSREAADEIERLRNERDEARREVCVLMQRTGFLRGDYADERGWDCFNESKRAAAEIERLREEREELQKWKDAHNTFWRDRAERRDAMREKEKWR
jgi:hypothetical protein